MGEISQTLINGEACSWCGVNLEPDETIYTIPKQDGSVTCKLKDKMPLNGSGYGTPIICEDCKNEFDKFRKNETGSKLHNPS